MPAFTVLVPTYNAEAVIAEALQSLVNQTFQDWECLVVDDCSRDRTEQIVRTFGDKRITFIKNEQNLGCAKNFQRCRDLAKGTFFYFLGHDDVLAPNALQRTYEAFQMDPGVALVVRPYYSFEGSDPSIPARGVDTKPLDPVRDRVITADDGDETIRAVVEVVGQVSGLAFRNESFTIPFNPWVWSTHIEPVFTLLKSHKGVFLHDYPVAIRIESSQSRLLPKIYEPSPLWSWVDMFQRVFEGKRWERQRKAGIDQIAGHFEGVVQIKCHSNYKWFAREAVLYAFYRPKSLLSPKFWAIMAASFVLPRKVLRKTADAYMKMLTRAAKPNVQAISASKTAA